MKIIGSFNFFLRKYVDELIYGLVWRFGGRIRMRFRISSNEKVEWIQESKSTIIQANLWTAGSLRNDDVDSQNTVMSTTLSYTWHTYFHATLYTYGHCVF